MEKRKDVKHEHHWTEENATMSEADVSKKCEGKKCMEGALCAKMYSLGQG